MDNKPLVSILIPNYNKSPYLRETLDSVLAQTYAHWECIIVDDHSTDGSWEILEEYADRNFRFKIFKRPDHLPKGGNVCRNFALKNSVGDYVLFLDSDDILAPFCLEQRIVSISQYPGLDFWAFPTALFTYDISDAKFLWNIDDQKESDLSRFLRMDVLWQTSGPIYSRIFIEKLGGFNPETQFWQDYEVHLKALIMSNRYKKHFELPPDVFIREGDKNSLSRSIPFTGDLKILKIRIQFLEEIFRFSIIRQKQMSQMELCSLFSFEYYLILQLWVRHGSFDLFIERWIRCCSKNKSHSLAFAKGLISGVFLKLNNRIGQWIDLSRITSRKCPNSNVLCLVQIGKHPISEYS